MIRTFARHPLMFLAAAVSISVIAFLAVTLLAPHPRLGVYPYHADAYSVTIAASILMMAAVVSANPFQVIVADVQAVIAKIQAGLQWFAAELAIGVKWVDSQFPAAQQAFAQLFQTLDQGAQALVPYAEQGLQDVISSAVDEAGTYVANALSRHGISGVVGQQLNAADVAAIQAAHAIAHGAVDTAFGKVLGALGQIATTVAAANTPPAASPQ